MRQGIFRQLRGGAEIEMENNLCFMKLDGFGRDVQERRDFFNGASFGNELQHFTLARRQFLPLRKEAALPSGEPGHNIPRQQRSHKILSLQDCIDGLVQLSGGGTFQEIGGGRSEERRVGKECRL